MIDHDLHNFIYDVKSGKETDLDQYFLIERTAWTEDESEIYYIYGENLLIGDPSALDYRGSYTFWKYNINKKSQEQLTNHILENTLDPNSLFVNRNQSELLFTQAPLFYLYSVDLSQ